MRIFQFKHFVLVAALAPGAMSSCAARGGDGRAIRAVLDGQVTAWNRGDIDGYMEGYWKSDELEFRTPVRVTTGWHQTRERYIAKYNTREKMGSLEFFDLNFEEQAADSARVTGRYRLTRGTGETDLGRFTLWFRRIDGEWVIVRDETKSDE